MTQPTSSQLPRSTPEAEGIPSSAVLAFLDGIQAEQQELHSFMLLRHGKVVAEGWWHPYRKEDVHFLYSLSKSFTSTGVGFAVSEGLLTVDDKVLSFFPEEAPAEPSANMQAMRVRDLLTMSAGHESEEYSEFLAPGSRVGKFLRREVPHRPGTHFLYNNGATYMLAAILAKLTGQTLLDYLRPRLFDPLGIAEATWVKDPAGINLGATGLSVTTETIAKFGQLYLQHGIWEGKRVLPEGWVAEATRGHVSNATNDSPDWQQGYGYQFWRCRHGAYRGDGAFGQNCVIMQEQDAVFVTTAGSGNLQGILDLLWKHLLPTMGSDSETDKGSYDALQERCSNLRLAGPEGAPTSPLVADIDGKEYRHAEGSFTLGLGSQDPFVSIRTAGVEHRIDVGIGEWKYGSTAFDSEKEQLAATLGAWPDPSTFVLRIQYVLMPAHTTLTFRFQNDEARVHLSRAGTFQPADEPEWECSASDR